MLFCRVAVNSKTAALQHSNRKNEALLLTNQDFEFLIKLYWNSVHRCIGICSLIPAERTPSLRNKPPQSRMKPDEKINNTFPWEKAAMPSRTNGKMKPRRTIPPQKINFFSPNKRRRTESFPCSEALYL